MKTVKLIAHTNDGKEHRFEVDAVNNQEAVVAVMSERFYGIDLAGGNTDVLITDNVSSITIVEGK